MKVEIFETIEKISPREWQRLVPSSFPFAQHAFFLALEQTGCLGRRTGWLPYYLCCYDEERLVGAMVLYSKTNSYGEYIFDFAWAQAYESYGLDYYPKLVSAIPFTPATGPKILLSKELSVSEAELISKSLLSAALGLAENLNTSSVHALFITPDEIPVFQRKDFFIRHSFQYHWLNQNYDSFQSFLLRLRSKRRKEILRERDQALKSNVQISRLTGNDLNPEHAESMYRFYSSTVEKMGGFPYLTLEFFRQVFSTMKDHILFVLAKNSNGEPIAGALNYFGDSTLFGRHWGCVEEYRALHFEVCYYQGIEFAIERGLKLFEAGAQGEHKFQRGFLPRYTYSAHQIFESPLKGAIKDFVEAEKKQIELLFSDYEKQTPFSRADE